MSNEEIVEQIQKGIDVKRNYEKLYSNNIGYIYKIAKQYFQYEEEEDLLNQAYFGLVEAVERYDSTRNVLFMTYASYWIKQVLSRYCRQCGSDIFVDSLDRPISSQNGYEETTLEDCVRSEENIEEDVVEKVHSEQVEKVLWEIVSSYTTTEENIVIRQQYHDNKTQKQIAIEKGVSISRISTIQKAALRKLRAKEASRQIREKCDIVDAQVYHGNFGSFDRTWTSIVERLAIEHINIEEKYSVLYTGKNAKRCS